MKTTPWLVLILGLAAGTGSAHPHEYYTDADVLGICDETGDGPSFGMACFSSAEVTPNADGESTFTIHDDVVETVGALYCQDLNADSICGDDGTLGGVVEPALLFCTEMTITSGSDWDPTALIIIFLDGPISGSPLFTSCGTASMATHGYVHHS
jgi:hypothetical protein